MGIAHSNSKLRYDIGKTSWEDKSNTKGTGISEYLKSGGGGGGGHTDALS